MSNIKTKKIVKKYAQALKEAKYAFKAVYLFGSHAKNRAHKWSDIDVAVVSNRLKKIGIPIGFYCGICAWR